MSSKTDHLYREFGGTTESVFDMLYEADMQRRMEAWKFAQQHLASAGDIAGQIVTSIMMGLLCEQSGSDGTSHFERARHLSRTAQGAKGEAMCCLEIAKLCESHALPYAHAAANLFAAQFEQAGQGKAYFIMGKGLLSRYQIGTARKYLHDAINLLKSTKSHEELAWALHYMHRTVAKSEQESYLKESLALSTNDLHLTDLNLTALGML